MSMISSYDIDNSDTLYKRYAILARSYLDKPEARKPKTAVIPLENLYRLLEMYRYNAFSDERRSGILDLDNDEPYPTVKGWHSNVSRALDLAKEEVFSTIAKTNMIDELESSLRKIACNREIGRAHV